MTDWKPGDRFKLEWEGVVLEFESRKVVQVRLDGHADMLRFYTDSFAGRATKLQRAFQFGDRVRLGTDLNDWRVLQDSGDEVILWLVGQPTAHVVKGPERHLLVLSEAT